MVFNNVISLTVWREPRRDEKTNGYLDFKRLWFYAHIGLPLYEVYIVCCGYVEHLEPFGPVNYVRIVASSPDSLRVFFLLRNSLQSLQHHHGVFTKYYIYIRVLSEPESFYCDNIKSSLAL